MGIRPRDLYLSNAKDGFKIETEVHEYTGAEDIIYGRLGINEISVAFSRKERFKRVNDIYLAYDTDKCHIFDGDTKQIIL